MKAQEDHRLLRGRDTRARILKNVTAAVDAEGVVGRIVSIMIGNTPEVAVYIRGQARAASARSCLVSPRRWTHVGCALHRLVYLSGGARRRLPDTLLWLGPRGLHGWAGAPPRVDQGHPHQAPSPCRRRLHLHRPRAQDRL